VDTLTWFLEFMARTSGFNSFMVDMTMQGLKRRLTRVPFQVLTLTPVNLKKMFQHLNMSNLQDRALWCYYLLSFYGLLKKSSAVPKSKSYDVKKFLVRRNISVDVANNMVYIYL
jgi:hypothetical protein